MTPKFLTLSEKGTHPLPISKYTGIERTVDILLEEIIMTSVLSSLSFSLLSVIQSFMSSMQSRTESMRLGRRSGEAEFWSCVSSAYERKLRYKQNMWRVYKHTGKDKDYEVYKEALNAATNEVRKAKRNFEHKLAQNIKSDSKRFYAYVRSKQNVRDKVGPLEDNAGNIITQRCLMAEELNVHFSSVFTREDTSSLPVPESKFNGSEEEKLGQLHCNPRSSS